LESTVKSRLKELIKLENITITSFEKSISVSNGYVNSIINSFSRDKEALILELYPNWSVSWILTGIGSKYNNENIESVIHEPTETYTNSNGNKFIPLKNGKYKIIVKKNPY
jgi:transcriptional regulator with XRE-family HTH domain